MLGNKLKGMVFKHIKYRFLIDEDFYSRKYKIKIDDVFDHFRKKGFKNNYNPSPLIDLDFLKKGHTQMSFKDFIKVIKSNKIPLSVFFDPVFYLNKNKDVKESGILAIEHLMKNGIAENRIFQKNPSITYSTLKKQKLSNYLQVHTPSSKRIAKIPSFNDSWDNEYIENHYFKAKSFKYLDGIQQFANNEKNVLIIGELSLVQCKKYRILQKIELFFNCGISTSFSHWLDVPRCTNSLQFASSVIFYRVPKTKLTNSYFNEAKRLGLNVGYDIDDPIFDIPTYSNNINLDYLDVKEKIGILSSSSAFESMIRMCDYAIASTPAMLDKIKKVTNKEVYLLRNMVDSESMNVVKYINDFGVRKPKKANEFTIVYMSGSRAHEADFRCALSGLDRILNDFEKVKLIIHGHALVGDMLKEKYPTKVKIIGFSDYYTYLESFVGVDLNIIPLVQDDFNNCKSAIRFMEAALFNVPSLISYTGDFINIVKEGFTGEFVREESEWYDKIKLFIESQNKVNTIGKAANKEVLEKYQIGLSKENVNASFFNYL